MTHPSVSVTNLLPGTEYQVRVRAADRLRTLGPWNDHLLIAKTEGEGWHYLDSGLVLLANHMSESFIKFELIQNIPSEFCFSSK